MKKALTIIKFCCILFYLLGLLGCASEPRYCVTTEAKTYYLPYAAQNIERIDISLQLKKEW